MISKNNKYEIKNTTHLHDIIKYETQLNMKNFNTKHN